MNTVQEESEPRSKISTSTKHEVLQDRLLTLAEHTIALKGLPALRARTLAEEAGCSVGAIYGVFADLVALILAVNARTLDQFTASMQRAEDLPAMAGAYLDYAAANRHRWQALFQHRMPDGRPIPQSYADKQALAFSRIEAPLATLCPALPHPERAALARTLFSAVHGVVILGLDEKVAAVKLPDLHAQLRLLVDALTRGLTLNPRRAAPA